MMWNTRSPICAKVSARQFELVGRYRPLWFWPALKEVQVIYGIQMGSTGIIKIGWTTQGVEERLAAIQTGNPYPLSVLWLSNGNSEHESIMHTHFACRRMQGEWFDFTDVSDIPKALDDGWTASGAYKIQPDWGIHHYPKIMRAIERQRLEAERPHVRQAVLDALGPRQPCATCESAPAVRGSTLCYRCALVVAA